MCKFRVADVLFFVYEKNKCMSGLLLLKYENLIATRNGSGISERKASIITTIGSFAMYVEFQSIHHRYIHF